MFIIKIIYTIVAILFGMFYIVGSISSLIHNIKINKKLYIPIDFSNDILPYLFFAGTGLIMIFLPFLHLLII